MKLAMRYARELQFILAAALAMSGACSGIEDPWVQSEDELKQERSRTAERQEQLGDRIRRTQTDR